jgi:tetratricopeptide (TPR) repeat protein
MRLRLLLAALPLAAGAAHAQTAADERLCSRVVDEHVPEAAAQAARIAAEQPATGVGAYFRGCGLLAARKFGDAEGQFARAAELAPSNAIAHYWRGRAAGEGAVVASMFKQIGLARTTKAEFERAVQLDPDYLDAREGLLQFYLLAPGVAGGSKDKAREQAREIERRAPYRGGFVVATLAYRLKDREAAVRSYASLATQFPDSVRPVFNLAAALLELKRPDEAWRAVDRFVSAHARATGADAMDVDFLVGRTAAESGQQLDRGAGALSRYLQGTPGRGQATLAAAHYRLGMVREKQGDRERARAEYGASARLDPKLKGAQDGLARTR